jgi:hypothetical protein
MATTTNFGWETPDDTDLVKDGALAIRTLGSAIDTSLVDLKGGTTGQVLSKNSNTDMDFTWVAQDDSNAIQNAIVDAKGDLISATAADTPARLAVGTNGQVLTADSTTSTGLKWATPATSSGGLVFISSTNLSATTNVNNCFTSTYVNYLILLSITSASTTANINFRLRASSVDKATNYDVRGDITANGANEVKIIDNANTYGSATIQISGPQLTDATTGSVLAHGINTGVAAAGLRNTFDQDESLSFDGFTIYSTATLTGTVRVYGYSNS